MSQDIKIPAVGESISSGVIAAWHKKEGEFVRTGEPLLTLDTDKVSTEIAAERDGIVHILVDAGREVKIGEKVGSIEPGQAPAAELQKQPEPRPAQSAPAPAPEPRSKAAAAPGPTSPTVRRMLEESQISASQVEGSGKGGRITKEDVEAFLAQRKQERDAPAATSPAAEPPIPSKGAGEEGQRITRKRLSPIRRKIADQLVHAQQTAAILTTFNEVDMTAVMAVRKRLQEDFQKRHGIKLGMMSFFIKAVVSALKEIPSINGRIDGDDFVQNHFYDIGVAVGTDRGLVVPVIRDADQKSFAQLENDLIDFASRAREGRIKLEELRGGVFTISNGGVYGSLLSTPILNPPQSGILGMHTIQDRPVAIDGQVVIRPMMYLALSYDHRVVDGKEAVTFLVHVKRCLEEPMRLVID
jgi:2-oxoglutarate dehydrogenase E2 component (dihydrolipoamide succinyltransferase)